MNSQERDSERQHIEARHRALVMVSEALECGKQMLVEDCARKLHLLLALPAAATTNNAIMV